MSNPPAPFYLLLEADNANLRARCERAALIGPCCFVCVLADGQKIDDLSPGELEEAKRTAPHVVEEWLSLIGQLDGQEQSDSRRRLFEILQAWTDSEPAGAVDRQNTVCKALNLSAEQYIRELRRVGEQPSASNVATPAKDVNDEARELIERGAEKDDVDAATIERAENRVPADLPTDQAQSQDDGDGEKPGKDGRPDYQLLARRYLVERALGEPGVDCRLLYYRGEFYYWTGSAYAVQSIPDMEAGLTGFLQGVPDMANRVSTSLVRNVIKNVEGLCYLQEFHLAPGWRTTEEGKLIPGWQPAPGSVSMQNGVLDLNKMLNGAAGALQPHSPRFFTHITLPYKYEAVAKCPKWLKFLSEMFPDQQIQDLLCEWFGYCLTYDTSQGKFMILEGQGANGKSVVCAVLKSILGDDNVSAVPLEAFNPQRTFPLAATVNKLANVVPDMSEVDKAAEGVIKSYADGEKMTLERKNRDSIDVKPTARLVFATNVLPRFSDRSDGLWRKMLLVPCSVQILDESKQNKKLNTPEYWHASGELPGIFNWAVAGLKRLRERGHFIEPALCKAARGEYKMNSNPAATFLGDFVKVGDAELPGPVLYVRYRSFCTRNGHGKGILASPQFSKEVKKVFPLAALSDNPVHYNVPGANVRRKGRVWRGLVYTGEDSDTPIEYETTDSEAAGNG